MKNLTLSLKKLLLLCALLVTSVANAGLITTELTNPTITYSETEHNSFTGMPGGGTPFDFAIQGLSRYTNGHWAEMSWEIDTTNLLSLSFDLIFQHPNYASSSISFGNEALNLESQTIDFSFAPFIHLANTKSLLTFKLTATQDYQFRGSERHDTPRLSFGNITLTRATSVPEPSTLVLFLLAMVFITRKQWVK